jgi:glycosyltransferase involved in cell wall biosynthesis
MTPLVSIILPTYNRLPLLREAVESVRAQTMTDWELIVIDDESTDGSVEYVERIGDNRMRVLRTQHRGDPETLRNVGAKRASAAWIAFLDSDDRWHPEKLERQLALHIASPALRWSYTNRTMLEVHGKPSKRAFRSWTPVAGWVLEAVITRTANIALPSVMVARDAFDAVGGFDERIHAGGDYDLWLRLAERYECGVLPEALVEIRSHRSSTHDTPLVNVGLAASLGWFAERTPGGRLRRLARRQQVSHQLAAAEKFLERGDVEAAQDLVMQALSSRPFSLTAVRMLVSLTARRGKSMVMR